RGLDPELDAAAVAAARLWKFEPTMHQGRPVAVRGNFTVTFGY
ncbi:MAG: energy transducer TonB, partial [Acidobacteria bacterium]|nr:energy transducer TonB [Acidobacteriota bacterium]